MERSGLRLVLSVLTIFVFVVLASMAAYFLQSSTATKRLLNDEHRDKLNLLQELENAIATQMFPPHDYLITAESDEKDVFAKESAEVNRLFDKLRNLPELEQPDVDSIIEARRRYDKMYKVETVIMNLSDPRGNPLGPQLMKQMHVHQNSILEEFDHFAKLEADEVKLQQQESTNSENRWFIAIGIIAALVASASTMAIVNSRSRL